MSSDLHHHVTGIVTRPAGARREHRAFCYSLHCQYRGAWTSDPKTAHGDCMTHERDTERANA